MKDVRWVLLHLTNPAICSSKKKKKIEQNFYTFIHYTQAIAPPSTFYQGQLNCLS